MTQGNNRSVTLVGANQIFNTVGITVNRSELGFYYAELPSGGAMENKTLTGLCQALVQFLSNQ